MNSLDLLMGPHLSIGTSFSNPWRGCNKLEGWYVSHLMALPPGINDWYRDLADSGPRGNACCASATSTRGVYA